MAAAVAAVHESGVNFNKLEKVEAIPKSSENAKEGVETYADYKVSRTRQGERSRGCWAVVSCAIVPLNSSREHQ